MAKFSWSGLANILVKGLAVAIPVIEKIGIMKGSTGPAKKAAAIDLAVGVVQGIEAISPAVIAHPKVQDTLSILNDAIVAVHNAVAEAQGVAIIEDASHP